VAAGPPAPGTPRASVHRTRARRLGPAMGRVSCRSTLPRTGPALPAPVARLREPAGPPARARFGLSLRAARVAPLPAGASRYLSLTAPSRAMKLGWDVMQGRGRTYGPHVEKSTLKRPPARCRFPALP